MDFNAVDQAVAEKARATDIEAEVQTRLGMVAAYGSDEYDEGTTLRFWKAFPTQGGRFKSYLYAAIKVGQKWFTTGPSQGQYGWTDLVLWLVSGSEPTQAYEVITVEPSFSVTMDEAIKDRIRRRAITVGKPKDSWPQTLGGVQAHDASRALHEKLGEVTETEALKAQPYDGPGLDGTFPR
jgi:hypothetical protein